MLGRAAYGDPYLFAEVDGRYYGDDSPRPSREDAIRAYLPYVARWTDAGTRLHFLSRHLLGLFAHQPGARRWKQALTLGAQDKTAGPEVLERALEDRLQRRAR